MSSSPPADLPPIPDELDIVPLFGTVVYPQTVIPLAVGQPATVRLFDDPAGAAQLVGMVALRTEQRRPENVRPDQCYSIGTAALVHRLLRLPDETLRVAVQGLERFAIEEIIPAQPFFRARIRLLPEAPPPPERAIDELVADLKAGVTEIAQLIPSFNPELYSQIAGETDPRRLTYLVAAATLGGQSVAERQQVLELTGVRARLERLRALLDHELRALRLTQPGAAPAAPATPRPPEPGQARWLRWSATGGEVVAIDAVQMAGRGSLLLTGQRGAAFRDAAQIALSWVRAGALGLGLAPDFYAQSDLHLHAPPGALPAETASAGLPLAAALVSRLSGRPLPADLALAGTITLHGRVLPVSQARDKALVAQHLGVKRLILPAANAPDLEQLPAAVRAAVQITLVEDLHEALSVES